jgi:octaprenyl-diphosphate synthase
VLVGDFLYSRAFQMMVAVGDMRVMQVLSDATNIIAEGEVLQLMNCHDADVDEARYLQVIRYKTAKLFEAARNSAPSLAVRRRGIERRLADYGMHLGTAFQLIDDVLDYSGAEVETGKHLGDDLAEGKPTLPLIYVMQNGTPEQAAVCARHRKRRARRFCPRSWRRFVRPGRLIMQKRKAKAEAEAALALRTRLSAYRLPHTRILC